ncbi:carbohydrate-binding protein [Dyella sp.]|uniref:carbohydrate-binding protein n=1 Tax=Dyella sp. TaxID=1869338 RepID=UPI002ED1EEEA
MYNGGATASHDHTNYRANWWTQGDNPSTNHGPVGSGKPWTSEGACEGGSGGGGEPGPGPGPGPGVDGLLFSPYKDATINMDWNRNVMRTGAPGTIVPLVGHGSLLSDHVRNLGAVTLAFATGECGSENWGGVPGASFASANMAALDAAGLNYVVSTGGAAGAFTCASTAGMDAFLQRYMTPHMVGLDFDIEAGQSDAQIQALVQSAVHAESRYPNLRYSFTVATFAASDGSRGSVNAKGDAVIRAVLASGLRNYTINLMAMDYGLTPSPAICVVIDGLCDMGRSAVQAAENVHATYGIPLDRIELTPMIAVNDVANEVFTLQDIDTVVDYAVAHGLAGVHPWSLDRDTPCKDGQTTASPVCNSLPGTNSLDYTRRFLQRLGY